jgi:hypothetical protein
MEMKARLSAPIYFAISSTPNLCASSFSFFGVSTP